MAQKNNIGNSAIRRIKIYFERHNIDIDSKKHNELIRRYFEHRGIQIDSRKLKEQIVLHYTSGGLDLYKENSVQQKAVVLKNLPKKKIEKQVYKRDSAKTIENLYQSQRWKDIKKVVYSLYEFRCMRCKDNKKEMHVDHIKPVSKFPELRWDISNLQLLCKDCNIEKSNINYHDYRSPQQTDLCSRYMNGEV